MHVKCLEERACLPTARRSIRPGTSRRQCSESMRAGISYLYVAVSSPREISDNDKSRNLSQLLVTVVANA